MTCHHRATWMALNRRVFARSLVALALAVWAVAGVCDTPGNDAAALPRLVDVGSVECIPCKAMAPILKELKTTYADMFDVLFVDVAETRNAVIKYEIEMIPTQIFYDAKGTELFRHKGFYSRAEILAKWEELGVDIGDTRPVSISRWEPAATADEPRTVTCYMCDGELDARTRVAVRTPKGDVRLCSPHCYFIMLSCLTEDAEGLAERVVVRDWVTGKSFLMGSAVFLYGFEEETGRPTIKAFAQRDAAIAERAVSGGSLLGYDQVFGLQMSTRCGFCDRAVYPQDAALVKAGGVHTWGCCSHCALGVAARTGLDIEVYQPDRLTGEMITVRTLDGKIASLEPATAVAWFGQRTKPDGSHASAGCFHQGFFTSPENLAKWLEANPLETGEMITIDKALAGKMALSAQQIQKACKIGECAPK